MEASYRFFSNRKCEYFPCHEGVKDFNCLFCYCPLYMMEDCGGNRKMLAGGVKDCSNCLIPHRFEGYDHIQKKLGQYFVSLQEDCS